MKLPTLTVIKSLWCLLLIGASLTTTAQTPLFGEVLISDVGTNNSIGHANTSRNLTVSSNGTIYAVFYGTQGIRVAKSTNRGQSFLPSVQVSPIVLTPTTTSTSTEEAEIEVSNSGTVYVAWNQGLTMYFSYSTDGANTFSSPVVVGTPSTSNTSPPSGNIPHLACYGNTVYLLPQSSKMIYRNTNGGVGSFSSAPVGTNVTWYFSDVRVDKNGDVYVVVDNPTVYLFRSTDGGANFNEVILSPRPTVSYSSYCLIAGSFGSYIFTGGSGSLGNRLAVATGFTNSISLMPNNTNSFGRSLLADEFGNIVDGYVNGGSLGIRVSHDQGVSWEPAITVGAGEISNIYRNYLYQDVLVAYRKSDGQVYLATYKDLLLGLTNTTPALNDCAGKPVTVTYTALGPFTSSNVFTAQLSDANGSFANPVDIGTVTSTTSGTINATIPANTPGGANYRIRVKSSSPVLLGTDNGTNLVVNPNPGSNFIFNANQCEGTPVVFTNTSTVNPATLTKVWDFGDNTTSTQTSPSHSYAAGQYQVKLVSTSPNGCKDSTTKTVTVGAKPAPAFTINTASQCLATNNFSFTNTTPNPSTFTYQWFFGDGGTATTLNAAHVYASPNTYKVKLIVTNASGCKDSVEHDVVVNSSTNPGFTINNATQCLGSNSFTFTNTTPTASTYEWFFGDGGTSNATSPTHTYTAAAPIYTVKLIATAGAGCKDSITHTVTVNPVPDAVFNTTSATAQCLYQNSFSFNNTSTFTGPLSYVWKFGDGTTATTQQATHSYTGDGVFNVKLYATAANGCVDSAENAITVYPKPAVDFVNDNPDQCLPTNHFTFTNKITINSGSFTNVWTYGDGGQSTGLNGDHTYAIFGAYTVKLVVTSDHGCKDSTQQPIRFLPKPVPMFTINDDGQCITGNNFSFTNGSSITSGSFTTEWRFGDGGTTTTLNAAHSYTTPNPYEVALILVSDRGCTDTLRKTVNVYPKPAVSFTIANPAQCLKVNSFAFTNGSTITNGTITYAWTFGDGGTATATNPVYRYNTANSNYRVRLIATSDQGCQDSSFGQVEVYPQPASPTFTTNQIEQCFKVNNYVFTNTSSATGVSYNWSYGDGTTGTTQNGAKKYADTGSYKVKLYLSNTNGCLSDTAEQVVKVHLEPTVDLGVDRTVLEGITITLNPVVTGVGNLSYLWTPNRYLASNTQLNPTVIPLDDVTYKLTVTGPGGCADDDDIRLTILKKLVVPNAFSPNGDGMNDTWNIPHLDIYNGCTVEVYSRSGQLVYRSVGYPTPWDGKYKGSLLPVGTYYYIIDPRNGREKFTGSLTLIR